MELVAIVTALVLIQYLWFTILVGRAREKSGIKAPLTTGDTLFECYYRVQQNTAEQLILFIPALWIFGYYVNPSVAAGLGVVFIVGRFVYLRGYITDPAKRGPGFLIGMLAVLALVIGSLVGPIIDWL
ncbi:MAG: MAPEG family protein [Gammaproteobacteria bacterium]